MKTLSALLFIIILSNCNKLNIESGTPKLIEDKITEFNKSSTCNDANVKAYLFQNSTVYTFDPGTCGADFSTEVVDSTCKSLGFLGGLIGNTKINGEEFSNAKFIKIVWKK